MSEVVKHSTKNEENIILTPVAQHRILFCLNENKKIGMRLALKKTGCSGLSYDLDYVDVAQTDDIVLSIADDKYIFIDKKSYPYLRGLKIDYVRQGINQKFTFENPNQTGQCGCGESFTVDDK